MRLLPSGNFFFLTAVLCLAALACIHGARAENTSANAASREVIVKAQIVEVIRDQSAGQSVDQTLRIKILEGDEKGKETTIDNNYIALGKGDVFYLDVGGTSPYSIVDIYRLPVLYFYIGLFVLCVLLFGGAQGIRGLFALVGSFIFIGYLLLPGILHGYSPILVSIGVASLIIVLGSYITHGFNKTTTSAVVGMIMAIVFTGLLASSAVHFAHLSGYGSEESTYLAVQTKGAIDFAGVLLGGIVIGLLGILYDAGISQAVAVEELHHAAPHLTKTAIYQKALRIGREHIGALVNTLFIAYVGAALPLLLLFYNFGIDINQIINQELFATEIIRAVVGSIGLILAIPITTLISVLFLVKDVKEKEHI